MKNLGEFGEFLGQELEDFGEFLDNFWEWN